MEIYRALAEFALPAETVSTVLTLDVVTRWNSTYDMLQRAFNNREAIAV